MPTFAFSTKPEKIYNDDGSVAYQRIKVPALQRGYCNMNDFRRHAKFGPYANSDFFLSMLKHAAALPAYIRMDRLPANVQVDTSGFLALVIVTVD